MSIPRRDWRPTRLITAEDRAHLEAVGLAPVILQEYVAGLDVRVIAVGQLLFAAEFDARATRSPEDYREALDECPVRPASLPPALAAGLHRLLGSLGLTYGAIDLRRREDGSYAFLEVNPSGLWRFVEERTGLPISEALARELLAA